jgi:hypothetical protein
VNVFGTADDVAPNFTTVAGAITYANSLTPIVTEPVVVRLFTKADGTPYDLTNLSSWTTYAIDYIYFVSDFVRLNETTTLPTTLPAGQQVWYIDANGVETLWVGREDGSAWPAVGYKEYVALLTQTGTNAPVATVKIDTIGYNRLYARSGTGAYTVQKQIAEILFPQKVIYNQILPPDEEDNAVLLQTQSTTVVSITTRAEGLSDDGVLVEFLVQFRIYP